MASAAASAGTLVGVTGTAAADHCEPRWAGDGDPDDYTDEGIVDQVIETDQESYPELEMVSGLHLIETLYTDNGKLYHLAVTGYGECHNCYGRISGQGVRIDVSKGSLYPATDRDEMFVAPAPIDDGNHNVDPDLAWSVLMASLGSMNPYTGAATAAADVVKAALFSDDPETDENNAEEYWWEHDNAVATGHYVDFYVRADYDAELTIIDEVTTWGGENCDSPDDIACDDEYTVRVDGYYTIRSGRIGSYSNEDKVELTRGEMKKKNVPKEIMKEESVYKKKRSSGEVVSKSK